MFNVWQFFPGYSVSLFHKISCGRPLLNRYCIYFWTALASMIVYIQYIWQVFLYLSRIVTSKEHMQPCIWVVPPLFREATCRDLVFSRVLSFFEISTCNRLCFQKYRVNLPPVAAIHSTNDLSSIIKEELQPQILSNLQYFFWTEGVLARRYHSYQL